MEQALIDFLLADAGIAALCGERIWWDERPQGEPLPAVVLYRITSGRDYTMKGRMSLTGPLVQIDCIGADKVAARDLGDAVIAAFDALPQADLRAAFVEGERGDFDGSGPQPLFRTALDVRVWHRDP